MWVLAKYTFGLYAIVEIQAGYLFINDVGSDGITKKNIVGFDVIWHVERLEDASQSAY